MISDVLEGTNWFHSKGKFIQRINQDVSKNLSEPHLIASQDDHQKETEGESGLEERNFDERKDDFLTNLHHRMWSFSNQELTIDPQLPHCSRFQTSIHMNKKGSNINNGKNGNIILENSSQMRKTSLSYLNTLSQVNGKKLDSVEIKNDESLNHPPSKEMKKPNKISKFTSNLLNRVIQSIYK